MHWLRAYRDEIQLAACFAILAAALFQLFRIPLAVGVPISIAGGGLIAYALFRTLERRRQPVRIEQHPDLGEVRVYRDRWEAIVPLAGTSIELSGGGNARSPSDVELRLFQQIKERFPSIAEAGIEALRKEMNSVKPPLTPGHLALSSVSLEPENGGLFSLYFDVPSRPKEFQWGLYVDYSDFAVEEAGCVH